MSERPALHALAVRVGILDAYVSTQGEHCPTSDATRVALLAALGHDASSEAAAERTLTGLEAEQRARLLDPVRVVREGERASLRLRVSAGARVAFRLEGEDGTVHERERRPRRETRTARVALPRLAAGTWTLHATVRAPGDVREARQTLIVAPQRCVSPAERLSGGTGFGLWTQLWSLRGERDLGIGDLGALRPLLRFAAHEGAAFVGISPLFALRTEPPEPSRYSPLSRLFRNPLLLEAERIPEVESSEEARRLLADATWCGERVRLRDAGRIDYRRVTALRRPLLEALHRSFAERERGQASGRGRAYAEYRTREGELLERFATFVALQEKLVAEGRPADWRRWPAAVQDPDAEAVGAFRSEHAEAVDFHAYLQFEIDRQLAESAREARAAGLPIGLYHDLPLGSEAGGFDTWAFPRLFVDGVDLGAPPDSYARDGQNWGLPPLDPHRLALDGYAYWRRVVRAGLAHCGALRIDHVMGLQRQFWIPRGEPASSGAYVRFPLHHLLDVVALESRRQGALVIGEDLGTVPRGLQSILERRGVLSSRVMLFERDRSGSFRPARRYSRRALVTANTHDLPTLAGFWSGRDLEIRRELGEMDATGHDEQRVARESGRRALRARLGREGCLASSADAVDPPELCRAVNAFLCRTPAPLVAIGLDDLLGETEPLNVPGVDPARYPSWTRRVRLPSEALDRDARVRHALGGVPPARRLRP
jgi:4-alpha-glucanotransferase